MRFRFSRFVCSVANFCEKKYRKIRIVFVERLNLFYYSVSFIRF